MSTNATDHDPAGAADRIGGWECPNAAPPLPTDRTCRRRRVDANDRTRPGAPTSKLGLAALALLLTLPIRAVADVPRLSVDNSGVVSVLVENQTQS